MLMALTAVFSEDRKYRYFLYRKVPTKMEFEGGYDPYRDQEKETVCSFIMLNPSVADEEKNDRTIDRCIYLAGRMGHGHLLIGNAYSICGTDPSIIKAVDDPVGRENDTYLGQILKYSDQVICAWGNNVSNERHGKLQSLLRESGKTPFRLGSLTKAGRPRHPLRLSRAVPILEYVYG